ncbi:DUF2975 domain-containing protein [Hirschia baltica]|uniref:Transmembrane protein n=1 Tax=Hirschia baltica (strain ATCC 49814 / DSM 5838 / IFAM 1418) TaxID=582402 RepID=C6XRG2_HIRBI|nr:DUF2975 domain-containing protein [Hirschia baltica]ACT58794.1 hypothetical protein Hbal_1102 [Hirschia baltica ATCC 49814]
MSQIHILPNSSRNICTVCKWLTIVGALALGLQLIFGNGLDEIVNKHWNMLSLEIRENTTYSNPKKIAVFALASLDFIGMYLLAFAIWRIFNSLVKHGPFSIDISKALSFMGLAIIIASLLNIIAPTLMALAITYDNPPQMHVLTIQLSAGAISMLFIGIVIRILGKIMLQASHIADENRQFV